MAQSGDKGAKSGTYKVVDRSLLLPLLKPHVWEPLAAHIPPRISANSITLLGSLCAALALLVVLLADPARPGWYALAAFFVFAYFNLDNLDGAHARRTGRSAPMGEFIDHWLDTLNGGLIVWAVAHAIALPPWAIVVVLASNTVAFYGTFAEQQLTGNLHMGLFGNIEGLVITTGLLLGMAIFGPEPITQVALAGPITVAWAMTIWTLLQNSWTAISSTWRCGRGYAGWLPLLLSLASIGVWHGWAGLSLAAAATLVVLSNAVFSGSRIVTCVAGAPGPPWGALCALALATGAVLCLVLQPGAVTRSVIGWGAVATLAACAAHDFRRAAQARAQDLLPDEILGWFFVK